MKKRLLSRIIVLFALLVGHQFVFANTIVALGVQDFADGTTPTTGDFLAAGAGEPTPFNGVFSGSDTTGPNFSTSWTFSFGALSNITGGNLVLGIYDHESAATGDQVSSFTLNGIDLTSALNTVFESQGGARSEDNVYTLALPSSTFAALATGSVTFALSLQGPGLGLFGNTDFNGAALDFSTLDIATQQNPPPPVPVPVPATSVLFLLGISALIAARRKMA